MFLFDLSHIWDDHFERLDFTQDLVLRDLQKTIERNDRTAQVKKNYIHLLASINIILARRNEVKYIFRLCTTGNKRNNRRANENNFKYVR